MRHLQTANERIWLDEYGDGWYADDRVERISRFLGASEAYTQADMERLHHDTEGRFRKLLLEWIGRKAAEGGKLDDAGKALVATWKGWDGSSRSNTRAFTQSTLAEAELSSVLLARVKDAFLADDAEVPYRWQLRRAWLLRLLEDQKAGESDPLKAFGLSGFELALHLVDHLVKADPTLVLHPKANKWQAQHPFVGRVPLIGGLFAVAEPEQWGAADLIAAEQPTMGPSMRVLWNLREPWKSTWVFPVGQSGHVMSPYYKNWQKLWVAGETRAVFGEAKQWRETWAP